MSARNLDAVIFDWGGTLTPWHTIDPLECWLAVTADEVQAAALHAAEISVWSAIKDDEHRSATFDQILEQAALTLTEPQRRTYYQWWDAHSYTDPAVPELFTALRQRGLKVGVLSNTTWPAAEHQRIFARDGVDHLIDGAVYSSEIAWAKPHPQAFRAGAGRGRGHRPGPGGLRRRPAVRGRLRRQPGGHARRAGSAQRHPGGADHRDRGHPGCGGAGAGRPRSAAG